MKHESIFMLEALRGKHSVVLKLNANIKINLCEVFFYINGGLMESERGMLWSVVVRGDGGQKKPTWSCATERLKQRGALMLCGCQRAKSSLSVPSACRCPRRQLWELGIKKKKKKRWWLISVYERIPFTGLISAATACFSCGVDASNDVELLLPSVTESAAADLPFPVHSSPLREQSAALEISLAPAIGDAQRRRLIWIHLLLSPVTLSSAMIYWGRKPEQPSNKTNNRGRGEGNQEAGMS